MNRKLRRANIISPHQDDAALSLACTLRNLIDCQIDVKILSCFTVSQWAPTLPEIYSIEEVSALREEEDAQYGNFLGASRVQSLGCIDAPLRRDWNVVQGIWQPPSPHTKKPLVEELHKKLIGYKSLECAWFVPMAFCHRDHLLARMAGIKVAKGQAICFYEDVPYSFKISPSAVRETVLSLQKTLGVDLKSRTIHDKFDSKFWLSGMHHYASQFNQNDLNSIGEKLSARGGERIWTTRKFDEWMGQQLT